MDPTSAIDLIEIRADGARRARVIHPESGVAVWHGLGLVGERLLLGHRTSERLAQRLPHRGTREIAVPAHYIEPPSNLDDLMIVSVGPLGRPRVATFADLRVADGAA